MPTLPDGGGRNALLAAIQQRLQYPEKARRNKVEGQVNASFIVAANGEMQDLKVVKSLSTDCDEAAIRAIRALPRLVPGQHNGQPVPVSLTVPVLFRGAVKSGNSAIIPAAERVYYSAEQLPTLAVAAPASGSAPRPTKAATMAQTQSNLLAAVQEVLVLPAEVLAGTTKGTVTVAIVVAPSGYVTGAKVVRGLSPACDVAALAAVRRLPRLVPGRNQGQAVAVGLELPIALHAPSYVYASDEVATRALFAAPGFLAYLRAHARVPAVVTTEKLHGRIRVEFIVRPDGQVDGAELKSHLCASCDAEALRLVRALPAWRPASDAAGRPVATHEFVEIPMPLPRPEADLLASQKVYGYVPEMPRLLNGGTDYAAAILAAMHYPEAVRREKITGAVGVDFVVDSDGLVRRPRITQSLCATCDQAVLDALTQVGPFIPGRDDDQLVPVRLQTLIPFNIKVEATAGN